MAKIEKVRIGVIGYGNMGTGHVSYLSKGEVANAELAAVCDNNPEKLKKAENDLKEVSGINFFADYKELIASGCVDLIIIAVPHYYHPIIGMAALNAKINVLSEKPIGVYTQNVETMNDLAQKSGLTYSIMFQQRTDPKHKKIKEILDKGELGALKRMVWIVTDWYRPQSYYNSGSWRATWSGEGGGVLMNQCPHNLDLWQWFFGMPESIRGFAEFGKYRDIEVEDDVTAYMNYANGATGVLITTTGETPGTNRLEISGDNGKLVLEHGKIMFWKNEISESEFNKTHKDGFGNPKCEMSEVIVEEQGWGEHKKITQNTVNNILNGEKLIAEAHEGIKSLSIANAIYLSTWLNNTISLPLDSGLYFSELQKRVANSKAKENIMELANVDMQKSFGR